MQNMQQVDILIKGATFYLLFLKYSNGTQFSILYVNFV